MQQFEIDLDFLESECDPRSTVLRLFASAESNYHYRFSRIDGWQRCSTQTLLTSDRVSCEVVACSSAAIFRSGVPRGVQPNTVPVQSSDQPVEMPQHQPIEQPWISPRSLHFCVQFSFSYAP